MFYLGVMLWGAVDSTAYSLQIGERAPSAWRPPLWLIKLIITLSFALMILQAIAHLIRDIAIIRGVEIPMPFPRGRQMSYEWIATLMFSTMLLMMITGQRVWRHRLCRGGGGAGALGPGGTDMGFSAVMKLMKWNAPLTLPMFVFMGRAASESRLAEDLYRMFHVWFGPLPGGLAIGTILLMVLIS